MSVAITAHIPERSAEYLKQRASELRLPMDTVLAVLLEESRRMTEFPRITFVDRASGRTACVQRGLDVWEYVMVARDYGFEAGAVADHLGQPIQDVEAALAYYRSYTDDVDSRLRLDASEETRDRSRA